jgi:probable addiction module antidote protein
MDKSNLSRFDESAYLDSSEARAEYLRAAMETEDAAFIMDALGVVAHAAGISMVASEAGLGREGAYKALRADRNPAFGTVLRVMHAMGLRLSVEPAKKELEPA